MPCVFGVFVRLSRSETIFIFDWSSIQLLVGETEAFGRGDCEGNESETAV